MGEQPAIGKTTTTTNTEWKERNIRFELELERAYDDAALELGAHTQTTAAMSSG